MILTTDDKLEILAVTDTYMAAGRERGRGSTVAMHATNTIVYEQDDAARALSKGLTVDTQGAATSFTYEDRLVRTDRGWRISHRRITPRREPRRGVTPHG